MPLVTHIIRNGETVRPSGGWDWIALGCFMTVAMKEANPSERINDDLTYGDLEEGQWVDWSMYPIYYMSGIPLLDKGVQVLKENHTFRFEPPGKRVRIIKFKKGDTFKIWRESSSK